MLTPIAFLLAISPASASLFFQESKSDKIKKNLESIGYEVLDSAGLVKDGIVESFDPDSLKDWLEAHGVTDAAQQTLETAKYHKDWLLEDIKDYAGQSQDFATALMNKGAKYFNSAVDDASAAAFATWSDSKVKEFLDARGVNVPQGSTRNQLNALAARVKHSLPVNVGGASGQYWFDGWTREELVKKLEEAGESVEGSRKELAARLHKVYVKSYDQGVEHGEVIKTEAGKIASHVSDEVQRKLGEWKEATAETFNSWSIEDLKDYVKDFGSDVSDAKDKLVESARYHYYYFTKGEKPPQTVGEKLSSHWKSTGNALWNHVRGFLGSTGLFHNDL